MNWADVIVSILSAYYLVGICVVAWAAWGHVSSLDQALMLPLYAAIWPWILWDESGD